MEFSKIDVAVRVRTGKGPARRLRQKGRAPAVLYGPKLETVSLSVVPKALIKALAGPLRTNTVLSLAIEGATGSTPTECKAIVVDHHFDPVSRDVLHVDFLALDMAKKISVKVPLKLSGRSRGEQVGGKLSAVFRTLPVECLPEQIPEAITADVSHLGLNETLDVKDIALPEGVSVTLSPDATIALVQSAKAEEDETKESDEEAAEGEAAKTETSSAEEPSA